MVRSTGQIFIAHQPGLEHRLIAMGWTIDGVAYISGMVVIWPK